MSAYPRCMTIMNLLNRKIDNALLILCYLHHKPDGGCAREIAGHFRLSRPFIANILKDLCHHGFVISQRGIYGGYILRNSTAGVSLPQVSGAPGYSLSPSPLQPRQSQRIMVLA